MATRPELVAGLDLIAREARRIGTRLTDAQWALPGDEGGWTKRDTLAHVAATSGMLAAVLQAMLADPSRDLQAGFDVDGMNAATVAQRSTASIEQMIEETERGCAATSRLIEATPDAQLEARTTLGAWRNVAVSDAMMMLILHGASHLYHLGAAPM